VRGGSGRDRARIDVVVFVNQDSVSVRPTSGVPQIMPAKRDYLRPEFVGASILLRRHPCTGAEDEGSQLLETLEVSL
jgi:hypothetical protein